MAVAGARSSAEKYSSLFGVVAGLAVLKSVELFLHESPYLTPLSAHGSVSTPELSPVQFNIHFISLSPLSHDVHKLFL